MILHYNWFCIDKRIDHLKWTSNNKNSYYTKELCSRFLHIHVLKNSRILYTFVRAYFAYLLLKNLRTVIVQKLQSVHWLLHIQINHDCIIIENIFNSCLWGQWCCSQDCYVHNVRFTYKYCIHPTPHTWKLIKPAKIISFKIL